MSLADLNLTELVQNKINQLGTSASAEYFGVTPMTVGAWKSGKNLPSISAGQLVLREFLSHSEHKLFDIQGKRVMLLLPIYRTMNGMTHATLFANYRHYGPDKIGFLTKFRTLIHEARNMLADMALSSDSEWFIYCDDDMVFPCGNGAMLRALGCEIPEPNGSYVALSRLMSHPADFKIVSALYFGRNKVNRAQVGEAFASDMENARYHRMRTNGGEFPLEAVRFTGFGMVRIHRSVFETMREKADELFPEIKPRAEGRHYGYFTPLGPDQGEDMAFCQRAAQCGFQTYLDPSLILGHAGDNVF